MRKIEFSDSDLEIIQENKDRHPNYKIRKRMTILWMRNLEYRYDFIAEVVGVHVNTIVNLIRTVQDEGLEGARVFKYVPKSPLDPFRDEIMKELENRPIQTLGEAGKSIEKICGRLFDRKAISRFLKKIGIRRRKTGAVPKKADPEVQKKFIEEELSPRLAEAAKKERKLYFVDAAHIIWGAFLGYMWSPERVFMPGGHGRSRFNVLGALDANSQEIVHVTNDAYIDRFSVVNLIMKIAALNHPEPVTLVLDNAAYQHARAVRWVAKHYGIELLFLPPYSPNLNLIERFWKFLRAKILTNQPFKTFRAMKDRIISLLDNLSEHKKHLATLLTFNFQSFTGIRMLQCK